MARQGAAAAAADHRALQRPPVHWAKHICGYALLLGPPVLGRGRRVARVLTASVALELAQTCGPRAVLFAAAGRRVQRIRDLHARRGRARVPGGEEGTSRRSPAATAPATRRPTLPGRLLKRIARK